MEVWYLRVWGTFHIVTGIIFSVIFILGALVVKDYSFLAYLILSGGLIFTGYQRLSKPYLILYKNSIEVRGLFGEISKKYEWTNKKELSAISGRIYLRRSKMHFNNWFTNKHQYEKLLRYCSDTTSLADELQD